MNPFRPYLECLNSKEVKNVLRRLPPLKKQKQMSTKRKLIHKQDSKINGYVSVVQQGDIRFMSVKKLSDGVFCGQAKFDDEGYIDLNYCPDYVGIMISGFFLFYEAIKRMDGGASLSSAKILVVGLGPGNLSTRMVELVPDIISDVVEIDPIVVKVAEKFFNFDKTQHRNVVVGDAVEFIKNHEGEYNAIFLDAYDGEEIPKKMRTEKFYNDVANALNDSEISFLLVNCFEDTLGELLLLCSGSFNYVHRLLSTNNSGNNIIVAYNRNNRVKVSSVLSSEYFDDDDKGE